MAEMAEVSKSREHLRDTSKSLSERISEVEDPPDPPSFRHQNLSPEKTMENWGVLIPIGSMDAIYIYIYMVTFTINIPQSC